MLRYRNFALFYILILVLSSCTSQSASSTQPAKVQYLRIINNGSYDVANLVVIFPGDRIGFGTVPAGETTEYKEVLNGVYRYAAYQFLIDEKVISQDVIDWMGENPMDGNSFTYTINFDDDRFATNDSVQLLEVKTDN